MAKCVATILALLLVSVYFVLTTPNRVRAQQALENVAAADAIYQDFPPKETLPPEELAVVLEIWDVAVESNDLRGISNAINMVTHGVPRPYRLSGAHVLRYDNPEIEDRLIELYLGEMANRELLNQGATLADIGIVAPKADGDGEVWEGDLDYMDGLVGPAHYTFSPKIYDAVLMGVGTTSRIVYLSMVNPENILGLLLDARPRERTHLNQSPDILDFPIERQATTVAGAFELLFVLCERAPDVVLAERDQVLDFVRAHALHYVEPVRRSYSPEPKYRWRRDYGTRVLALKSLELLAQSADVYSVVDDIVRNPPDNPAAGPNEITREGLRLIEQIRALK